MLRSEFLSNTMWIVNILQNKVCDCVCSIWSSADIKSKFKLKANPIKVDNFSHNIYKLYRSLSESSNYFSLKIEIVTFSWRIVSQPMTEQLVTSSGCYDHILFLLILWHFLCWATIFVFCVCFH